MISEILEQYNKHVSDSEICFKNNSDNEHDYESINRTYIIKNIIEIECFCCYCGSRKFLYDYELLNEEEL